MSSPDLADLQSIVAALNEPPFNQSLTLVAFSELRGYEALQLLNDVIAVVDPKQKKDIRDENADATWIRIVDFLGVCKYPNLPMADLASFQSALMSGSPDVHHALIFWIIQNLHTAQKRCHLARFLRPPELPDQLMADADVVSERQRHLVLQSEFKTVHQAYDKMKGTALNPQQLQEEIQTLEHEKEKLLQKLAKMKEKVTNGAEFQNVVFDDVLRVTNQLRREQEEEQRIAQQTREQKHKVIRAEQIKAQTSKKLNDMQTNDVSRMDPNKLLQRLRNDVKMQRELCEEKLEKAIREKEKNLRELEKTMSSEPMSIEEVEDLEHELDGLRQHVEDLTAKRDHMHRSSDGQLSFMRNSIIASERKRDAAIEKLSETEEEFKEAEDDLRRIQADLNSLSVDGQPPKTEAQMKQYMKDLAVKTETYKKYKAELEADRAEVGVLSRTEAILKSRDDNLAEFNAELEKQRGVAGFQTAQETLENISADKANIDTTKGETLEQISNIVTTINATLKERKNNLAPKIKDLRAVRLKFEEIEQVYTAKKKVYDNVALGLESERLKLDQDVQSNLQGVAEEETSYHSFHIASQIQNVRAQMMSAEQRYQSGQERLSSEYKSYREMYEKGINEQEALSKALRIEKKNLTEKHEGDVAQRSMFLQLRKLLNAKVTIQKQLKEQQAQDPYQQMGGGMGMGMNMGMAGAYPPYGGQQYGGNSMIME